MDDEEQPVEWRILAECINVADVARLRAQMGAEARMGLLVEALGSHDLTRVPMLRILSWALEEYGAGMPEGGLFSDTLRADAQFWAACATPHELSAYAVAAIEGLQADDMHERMAKRLLVAAWSQLSAKARADFLGRVDPKGQFRGK
jgi:hypothetical protein